MECVVLVARAVGTLTDPLNAGEGGAGPLAETAATRDAEFSLATQIVDVCWRPLLSALSTLMARFASEEGIQILLKCYQAFTQSCAALALLQPRDAFLASLCHYALPPSKGSAKTGGDVAFSPTDASYEPLPHTSLSAKNVQVCRDRGLLMISASFT